MCFIFQAEDGIRDRNVTGVQTCALPISRCNARKSVSTAPLLACVAEPTGKTLTTAPRCGCRTHVTHSGESSTGVVFGMQHTVVNPPAAAAAVPDAIVSL